jgi:hypothetical protein
MSVWCSTLEEAVQFINNPDDIEPLVRSDRKYVVIEEVSKLYGNVNPIEWWVAEYADDDEHPTMVKLDKCPICISNRKYITNICNIGGKKNRVDEEQEEGGIN